MSRLNFRPELFIRSGKPNLQKHDCQLENQNFLLTSQASAAVYIPGSLRVSEKSPLYMVMPGIRFHAHVNLTTATHFGITRCVPNIL